MPRNPEPAPTISASNDVTDAFSTAPLLRRASVSHSHVIASGDAGISSFSASFMRPLNLCCSRIEARALEGVRAERRVVRTPYRIELRWIDVPRGFGAAIPHHERRRDLAEQQLCERRHVQRQVCTVLRARDRRAFRPGLERPPPRVPRTEVIDDLEHDAPLCVIRTKR